MDDLTSFSPLRLEALLDRGWKVDMATCTAHWTPTLSTALKIQKENTLIIEYQTTGQV